MTDNPEQYSQYPQQPPMAPFQAPQPGVIPLRPLDVGAMISGSFRAVFRNWLPTLLLPFVGSLIVTAVGVVPMLTLFNQLTDMAGRRADPDQVLSLLGRSLLFLLLELVLVLALSVLTQAVVTVTVSRAVLGRPTTIPQALRAAAPRLLPLAGLAVLVWLIAFGCAFVPFAAVVTLAIVANAPMLGLLAFVVLVGGVLVGAFYWISYATAPAALVLEPAPVLTALRRSRWLVTNNWWRALGVLLLCGVIVYFASYLVELPISFVQLAQMGSISTSLRPDPRAVLSTVFSPTALIMITVLSAVVYALGQAFTIGVSTLLYHDLRIRKESFHLPLWQMAQLPDDLNPGPGPSPSPEATT
ncbi:hypothetical protein [Kutzneria sp. CA-103260]|uniref:hypothetical protein n=1 Tax=Kutzneria sp. CA-103260 TaxID=2802641 RepID=UPI001BADC3BE|nr:hypothetical protein [Kutzneria sp. CA-103260]QUQ63204.1 membrane protein [Kutzneria sp. CA-103260]